MPTHTLSIRKATSADVASIVSLVQSAYRGDSGRQGWTTESDLLDGQRTDAADVQGNIDRVDSCILLALYGDAIAGCCHTERDGHAAYFGMFAVAPTSQGLGVGDALLRRAEMVARDDFGCTSMKMSVIDLRVELIAFYERRGYVRTGEYKAFPYGDERFGIPRRDDLRFALARQATGQGMNGWVNVGTRAELLPGEFRVAWDGDTAIAVYNIDGQLYAIEDICTHDGGELAGGDVSGFEVECPRHGARFDLRTGEVTCPPAYTPAAVFPVREHDGAIWTRDDR